MRLSFACIFWFILISLNSHAYIPQSTFTDSSENLEQSPIESAEVKTQRSLDTINSYDPAYRLTSLVQTSRGSCRFGQRPTRQIPCKQYKKFEGNLVTKNVFDGSDYRIPFHLYRPTARGIRPLIIIIPSIDGVTVVEKDLAEDYSEKGYNVIVAVLPEDIADLSRPLSDINGFLLRTTISLRVLIDYAEDHPNIDTSKIGAFGASLGGIRLLILSGVDDRIDASVVYVGAGNIPEVLASSTIDQVKNYRNHIIKKRGFSGRDEYRCMVSFTEIGLL